MVRRAILVIITLTALAPRAFSDDAVIDLGGLRKATATLTTSASAYEISVRMLPVHSFDVATNARLNRDKARELALLALAKHLAGEKSVALTISGARVLDTGSDGKFYTLTLKIPRAGVVLAKADSAHAAVNEAPLKENVEQITFSSALFTRKREYQGMAEQLTANVLTALQAAEKMKGDGFFLAVAELEERGLNNFASLQKDIQEDRLLLALEQTELNETINARKNQLMDRLRDAVKKHR